MTIKQVMLVITALVVTTQSHAMSINNRYLPWYTQPFGRTIEKRSHLQTELFFMTGDKAFHQSSDESKGIPEVWGKYNQKTANDVLLFMNIASPLRAQWQAEKSILWDVDQKIESQGLTLKGEWTIGRGISFGGSSSLMRINCNQTFSIPFDTRKAMHLTPDQENQLDSQRRAMNELIGITSTQWSETGLSDTELYVRWGNVWEYELKSRQVDAGIKTGFYFSSGVKRDEDNPASIPFGSNGMNGFFFGGDIALEVKEDWTVGMAMQLSKHFEKIQKRRLPVKKENYLFGGTTGTIEIDPGVTFVWNPFLRLGDLQDGVDAHIGYTLAHHAGDVWTDKRADKTITVDLNDMYKLSKWDAEYLSIYVSYDPSKVTKKDKVQPIITINWDAPVKVFVAEDVSKTHKIALGIAFDF
jgi:hypothetical protein